MIKLYCRNLKSTGEITINDEPLGKGGEGSVYSVISHTFEASLPSAEKLVVKLYHDPSENNRGRKIAAMLQKQVSSESVAWPLGIVFDSNKTFIGYVMIKLSRETYRPWEELSNARDRRRVSTDFDFRYALTSCRNLATSIDLIHHAGHRVGDINESNIFVSTNSKTLIVDSDSAQISSANGSIFPCTVGKAEYTAPEISQGSFKDNPRTIETDVFAYTIAAFQMLTGGFHPTDGVYLEEDEQPLVSYRIKNNIYPSFLNCEAKGFSRLERIPLKALPIEVQQIIFQGLSSNPDNRPSLDTIISTLDKSLENLKQCEVVSQHWYSGDSDQCPWCNHYNETGFDPWSPTLRKSVKQRELPEVDFSGEKTELKPKRAPLNKSSNQQPNFTQTTNQHNSIPHSTPQAPLNHQGYQSQTTQGQSQQSYPPQGYSQQANSNQSYEDERKSRFYKGRLILEYADGSRRVRPDYSVLLKNNPRVAIHCIKEETPSVFKAWWSTSRPVAKIEGLLIGLVLGIAFSLSWIFLTPWIFSLLSWTAPETLVIAIKYFISLTALASVLYLFSSALFDLLKTKKRFKTLDRIKREAPWKTILRFLPLPIFYGPILSLMILFGLISLALDAIMSSNNRY